MAAVGNTIYVFGGRDLDHKELNEQYPFDTSTNTWTILSSGELGPPHRSYHSMAADDRRIYVFGGCGNAGRLKDLWAFDTTDGRSVEFPIPGESCRPRGGPGLTVCGGKVWVVYGFSGEELDDVYCFNPLSSVWTQVETDGDKPTTRSVFPTAASGKYIVVYGGEIDPSDLGHLGAGRFSGEEFVLDTETRSWSRMDVAGEKEHPRPRGWCAFSAGDVNGKKGLLVYGENSPTNDVLVTFFSLSPVFKDRAARCMKHPAFLQIPRSCRVEKGPRPKVCCKGGFKVVNA